MDFGCLLVLRAEEVIAMDDVHEQERAERIAAAFALLTAKLEDAAGLAADGQKPGSDAELRELAHQIAELSGDVNTIAAALAAVLRPDQQAQRGPQY